MTDAAYPVIRTRPKRDGRFRDGHPWVYKDELVLDRRARALEPGSVAILENSLREPMGLVAVNSESGISARDLDRDVTAHIDEAWVHKRLQRALAYREKLFPAPYYRLCHAEGDGMPGLVIDRMGDALSVQPNTAWAESVVPHVLKALDALLSPKNVVVNRDSRGRTQEGLEGGREQARGSEDGPVRVEQNGAVYLADMMSGQKTGVYFDQRPNHAFVARLAGGGDVLDVFGHTGGFSMACLAAGASSALCIDSSEPALGLASKAAELNGFAAAFEARRGDAFEAMKALAAEDRRFETVVCDPPAFAPSKQSLTAGLRAYERTARLAVPLVKSGGMLTVCSCSHAVTPDALRETVVAALRIGRRSGRLLRSGRAGADHPTHPSLPEAGYLKALTFLVD
jgi:23S rRNA (cytosine1962-C5)-methyltransferase